MDYGPPAEVIEAGVFEHPCEGEVVCKLTNDKVPSLRRFRLIWLFPDSAQALPSD